MLLYLASRQGTMQQSRAAVSHQTAARKQGMDRTYGQLRDMLSVKQMTRVERNLAEACQS